jgi:DUF438 domain-containing protein
MSELIDNRAQRIRTMKEVVQGLDRGEPVEGVKRRLKLLVTQCDASEIAAMEQQLLTEGTSACELMRVCDLHSQVLREVLVERGPAPVPPGHPVDTFRRENAALREQAGRLRASVTALAGASEDQAVELELLDHARREYGLLMDVEKHYRRKEHLLFSFLERHGVTGPSTVMWGKDDEVRALLKELGGALAVNEGTAGEWRLVLDAVAEPALAALEEMIFKEERILLPMSLQTLDEHEWGEIAAQSPQFGYCLVDPAAPWVACASPVAAAQNVSTPPRSSPNGAVVFPTGALSVSQLSALFAALPVDLTFVDKDDRVRFFSEGKNRVFHRAKAVIGRKVQHCHPPASVGTVDRILADFRSGAQDVAEFWIQMRGRFVHVRYFALRDEQGAYLGTLEVTQDLTRERVLTGERRLLEYDA